MVENLKGKTYNDLSEFDRNRLDESILHATVMKQDEPDDGQSSVYMIFERLNTGGMPLQPQEVRACVYYGDFNELLCKLANNEHWRSLFSSKNLRLKEEELILRYFAFLLNRQNYKGNYKYFLNDFMSSNRSLQLYGNEQLSNLFNNAIGFIVDSIGGNAFKTSNQLNAAIFDSVMIGVAERMKTNHTPNPEHFKLQYESLLADPEYKQYVESTTSGTVAVNGRINKAIEFFSTI